MGENQKAIWNRSMRSDYVEFNGETDITFVSGDITTAEGLGGKESYEFDVIQTVGDIKEGKTLGTQAKGLLKQLFSFAPLEGKRFSIERFGTGFSTTYTVKEI